MENACVSTVTFFIEEQMSNEMEYMYFPGISLCFSFVNLVLIGGMFLLIAGRCPDTFPVNRDTLLCKTSTPVSDPGRKRPGSRSPQPNFIYFYVLFFNKNGQIIGGHLRLWIWHSPLGNSGSATVLLTKTIL